MMGAVGTEFKTLREGKAKQRMIPEPGQKFGPYEILDRLGSGAMGLVFRAWDARLHREVAIKLLHSDYEMPGMRERFLQEARAASALNHPHICTIFDLGEQDGEPYMVMELLEGETLKEKISRGAVPTDEIISYSQEVADALAAAHAKGIVHRDVKPANIFLVDQPNGRKQAKVLDFGLAKIGLAMRGGRASRALDLTLAGATVGTLSYMSPEQARGQTLDERSDLFSLGVVMYEMATRQVPFQGATSAVIFVQLLNSAPEPIHDWNDSIPKDLERIVLKLLSKERDTRFQNANELAQALRKIPFRSGGRWLKRAAAAVPLVKAADPVARVKRPQKVGSDQNADGRQNAKPLVPLAAHGDGSVVPPPVRSSSSPDNTLIRPVVRAPHRNGERRDEGILRGDRTAFTDAVPAEASLLVPAIRDELNKGTPSAERDLVPADPGNASLTASQKLEQTERFVESADPKATRALPILDLIQTKKTDLALEVEPAVLVPAETPAIAEHTNGPTPALKPSSEGERLDAISKKPRRAKGQLERQAKPAVERPEPDSAQGDRSSKTKILGVGLIAVVTLGALAWMNSARFRPTLLKPGEPLLLTVIQNRTNDQTLDGSLSEGLDLLLQQSQYLTLRSGEAYRAGLKEVESEGTPGGSTSGRRVAQLVGAKAYLYGEIRSAGAGYVVSVDVLKTDSNDKLTSLEESADSRDAVVPAIDRLSTRIRRDMGESDRTGGAKDVPLEKEATADLGALKKFAQGEIALQEGRVDEAIAFYESAKLADPGFAQVHLRLAWLYQDEHAEASAAREAKRAREAARNGSERLHQLAEFCYQVNAAGDYTQATGVARQFREMFPNDPAGLVNQARVLGLEGHMPESLQSAQQAYAANPYDGDAYGEAVHALIALDRYPGALQLQEQMFRLGLKRESGAIAASFLSSNTEELTKLLRGLGVLNNASGPKQGRPSYRQLSDNGLILDIAGRISAGAGVWRSAALRARSETGLSAGLKSAESYLWAQAGLNRALVASCDSALEFAREVDSNAVGPITNFDLGMTFALCGNETGAQQAIGKLKQFSPNSSAVRNYYVADIRAAIALQKKDYGQSLTELATAAPYDTVSLTPYLRGLAQIGKGNSQAAVVDFQTVVDHPGASLIGGSDVYPMAQIGLARAYANIGDKVNSSVAYRRFAALWHQADQSQGLLMEALVRGR